MTRRTVRRWALRIAAALLMLMLAGATYQGVATAIERREFPRTGGLIDVGDHQLHLSCVGEGSPTVVLEAGAGGMSAAWARVQAPVARVTRVCAYDRAGLGWSERSDAPYDPGAATRELRALLENAGVPGPFVVAGHGLGAAFARLFVSQYRGETAALIEIDFPAAAGARPDAFVIRFPGSLPWLARIGLLRLWGLFEPEAAELPEGARGALEAFLNRPDHLSRAADELSHWDEILERARAASPGNTPVVRLGTPTRERIAFPDSERESAPVVAAILDAVRTARAGAEAPPYEGAPSSRQ